MEEKRTAAMKKKLSLDEKIYQIIIYVCITLVLIITIVPLLYVVSMSFTSQQEILNNGGRYTLFPKHISFSGYEYLINGGWMGRAMFISVSRVGIGTFFTVLFTSIGAYVLARRRLPGRTGLIFMVLATILFGAGLVPSYLLISKLGLKNKFIVYILPTLVDPWSMLVIKQFMEQLPEELYEASRIDGANDPFVYIRIYMPLSMPVLAAIGLFTAVGHWNSWFDAFIYVQDSSLWPFQLVLRNVLNGLLQMTDMSKISSMSADKMMMMSKVNGDTLKMAAVIVGTVPILCVYPFLQKYFTKGVLVGSVKG